MKEAHHAQLLRSAEILRIKMQLIHELGGACKKKSALDFGNAIAGSAFGGARSLSP